MNIEIPETLCRARRSLEELSPCLVVDDWIWDDSITEWCLSFTAHMQHPVRIPKTSSWVFTVSPEYPNGKIKIYPASNGGIKETYPHQSNNGLEGHGRHCRSGNVCLFSESVEWWLQGDIDFTLYLYAERFLGWIDAANEGTLVKEGDHVEFPMQNLRLNETVLFCEDEISKMKWSSRPTYRDGVVETIENSLGQICLSNFFGQSGNLACATDWGAAIENDKQIKSGRGIWFLASSIPHIRCWQSPNTYGELREWANSEKLDIDSIIARNSSTLRDGSRHYLAIGVPCASIMGEDPQSLSWFIAKMPVLADGKEFGKKGAHKHSTLNIIDRQKTFAPSVEIDWVTSTNCAKDQMHSRGSLCDKLIDSRIALIGAGSLGSMVANNLVRGGATDLCIFDSDRFRIGNSTRHLLRACDAGREKAPAVASLLNETNPMGQTEWKDEVDKNNAKSLKGFDVIIDCSASPSVLSILDSLEGNQKLFVCSFGYAAEKVYISATTLSSFSVTNYLETFRGMMREDASAIKVNELPWEGVGCWSPVFPAKNSDVSRAASIVADCINCLIGKSKVEASYVYTTERDADGALVKIERIEL